MSHHPIHHIHSSNDTGNYYTDVLHQVAHNVKHKHDADNIMMIDTNATNQENTLIHKLLFSSLTNKIITISSLAAIFTWISYYNKKNAKKNIIANQLNNERNESKYGDADIGVKYHLTESDYTLPALQFPNNFIHIEFGDNARNKLFYLRPKTIFVNHGSYGCVPRLVMDYHIKLLKRVELAPDLFMRYHACNMNRLAIQPIAKLINANAEDVVFVNNATAAVNTVLNSLNLKPGQVIITPDLTYNACKVAMKYACERSAATYLEFKVPLPVTNEQQILNIIDDVIKSNSSSNIVFALFDVITSPHALIFPYESATKLVKSKIPNIKVMLDAAHAIGQIRLDLNNSSADYLTSNCHKWLFSPKGTAILWCRKSLQHSLYPSVASHFHNLSYIERFFMQATKDYTAYIATYAAMEFYTKLGFDRIYKYNTELADFACEYLSKQFNTKPSPLFPKSMESPFMRLIPTPIKVPTHLKTESEIRYWASSENLGGYFMKDYDLVLPCFIYDGIIYIRFSTQIYNVKADYIAAANAIIDFCNKQK